MIIVAGVAGICLWGLFSLLDNLKEPGLLRTTKGIAVKGCSSLDGHADAPKLCPSLLCQKALVDRKLVKLDDPIEIANDATDGASRVITAVISGTTQQFECVVDGVTVTQAASLEATT